MHQTRFTISHFCSCYAMVCTCRKIIHSVRLKTRGSSSQGLGKEFAPLSSPWRQCATATSTWRAYPDVSRIIRVRLAAVLQADRVYMRNAKMPSACVSTGHAHVRQEAGPHRIDRCSCSCRVPLSGASINVFLDMLSIPYHTVSGIAWLPLEWPLVDA